MNALLALLILAADPAAPIETPYAEAVEIFHSDFEADTDVNFDDWPDGWTRRVGLGYPQYLSVSIVDDTPPLRPEGKRALRIELDGGAATLYSPPIPVSPLYSYVLSGHLKTKGLDHDVAFFSVTYLDKQGKPLTSHYTSPSREANHWQQHRLGPMMLDDADVHQAVIGVHLHPTDSADLTGAATFDDIVFARLPRMTLRANSEHNVYTDANNIEVTCQVSGIRERNPTMHFDLMDERGTVLAAHETRLEGNLIRDPAARDPMAESTQADVPETQANYEGSAVWRPPIQQVGFYRVRVTMRSHSDVTLERSQTLAVLRPQARPVKGEFGWTLPDGEKPLPLKSLVGLLTQVGINWVKFPVWYSDEDHDWADRLAWFADRLSNQNVELVGMLDQPPEDLRKRFGDEERPPVASVFVEPELWQPAIDPVMTRLSLKVRWWQLGGDDDTSYVGLPNLQAKIGEIKRHLERFGQEIRLGIGWRWLHEIPDSERPPWEFLSLTVDPSFTQAELQAYLKHLQPTGNVKRWIVLRPLPRSTYDVETRATDLVRRMMAAKVENADAAFVPNPFDAETGLMNPDGTPGELLLPWRTAALMLSGTQFVGSITFPGGSENYVFSRGNEAVMVVWNESPTTEKLYLGDDLRQVDMWGRETIPQREDNEQIVHVDTLPTFLTGVNLPIAQWRMDFAFDTRQLASVFGREQFANYRFQNHFDQGVSGKVTLIAPVVWDIKPQDIHFKLAAGEERVESFQVLLRADASSGEQPIRVDIEITADRTYKFSVYRSVRIGLGDVVVELNSHLAEDGSLVVEQHLINNTDDFVSFNCLLFAHDRRRLRTQVLNLGHGRSSKTYVLPNGEELIGKTLWVRAEEIGGARMLNFRIDATR